VNSKHKGSRAEREIVLILKDEGYQDVRVVSSIAGQRVTQM